MPQHPLRYDLISELHARPFPEVEPGSTVAMVAFIPEPWQDPYVALNSLLRRHAAPPAAEGVNQYNGMIGAVALKWERHSEFVTYTLLAKGLPDEGFAAPLFKYLPDDWMDEPGALISSALMRIEANTERDILARLPEYGSWFNPESLAVSAVGESGTLAGSDFRLDADGHVRIAILTDVNRSPIRVGRLVQRLLEIEVYKSMAMLSLPVAREAASRLGALEREHASVVSRLSDSDVSDQQMLDQLLHLSSEIQNLSSMTGFRFSAAVAYSGIVAQRLELLKETRVPGHQLLSTFMLRRFDPAMRTCQATRERLKELSDRATRTADLLRTRVNVAAERQNQELLDNMNARAEQSLRLQETVEGLSVVAISYYAVSLLGYLLAPVAEALDIKKSWLLAATVPVVLITVILLTRAVRKRLQGDAA